MIFQLSGKSSGSLYGAIYGGDARYIVGELKTFLQGKSNATIHMHTPGGSVFDGNLIYNTLRAYKGDLTIIIDGISASMGTIIMLAADTIKIADNGWIMIHSPAGIVQGNAKAMEQNAKVLRTLEAQFMKHYMARTSKTEEEVKDWLDGDNWFSADMAFDENLVDEVVDPALSDEDINAYHEMMNVAACIENFESDKELKERFFSAGTQTSITPKINNNMKLNAKTIVGLGIDPEAQDSTINAAIDDVVARNSTLEKNLKKMEDEQEARQAKATETLISAAVKSGKIKASDKERYQKLAKSDFDLAKDTIDNLPIKDNLTAQAGGLGKPNTPSADGRDKWTYKEWKEKDYSGLLKMAEEEPERYKQVLTTSNLK